MKLFDIVSDKFFSPLTGKNKSVYIDCLNIIYQTYNNELSYGVEKGYILEKLIEYFENNNNNIVWDEQDVVLNLHKDKASMVIRRLKECDWLEFEQVANYKTIVNLYDYSITMIESMNNITSNKEMEYEASVAQIYVILGKDELYRKPYSLVIRPIYNMTKHLISGLKKLNTNIRRHIDTLTYDKQAEDIIKMFFDYQINVVSTSFQRIHTSDNISSYRTSIQQKLLDIKNDENLFALAVENYMYIEECYDENIARNKISELIFTINNAFGSQYDEIVHEITVKNEKYINSAVARAKFLLSNSNDMEGKISHVLHYISNQLNIDQIDINDYIFDMTDSMFDILSQGFIDNDSLYAIPITRKNEMPEQIIENPTISAEDRLAHREKLELSQKNKFTKKNINAYVEKILQNNDTILASSLPLDSKRDILRIIYISLYGQNGKSGYMISHIDKEIKEKNYKFRDFRITRRSNI